MSKILDGIVKTISSKIVPYKENCNNVYFKRYVSSIQEKRDKYISYIDVNFQKFNRNFISNSVNFALEHICVENDYSEQDIENYILYLAVTHLNDQYYNHHYEHYNFTLYVKYKISPDTYIGAAVTKDAAIPMTLKPKDTDLKYLKDVTSIVSKIMAKQYPMPFCIETDMFVGIEYCNALTSRDPYFEVIKDVANQMKCLKKYRFDYLTHDDIGRSKTGLRRYFIYNFDSIAPHNGQFREQLVNMVTQLCKFFTHGSELTDKFRECVDFLDSQDDDKNIYDQFILYLLNINE
jgi:hypothetical protein